MPVNDLKLFLQPSCLFAKQIHFLPFKLGELTFSLMYLSSVAFYD